MKNFFTKCWIAAFVAVIGFVMAGCISTPSRNFSEPVYGAAYNIAPPAKNAHIIGIVRVETTVDANGNGGLITYDALLKASEAVGGNGIANIMIDKKEQVSTAVTTATTATTYRGGDAATVNVTTTWYGSALAIKFTDDNLPPNTPVSTSTTSIGNGARQ